MKKFIITMMLLAACCSASQIYAQSWLDQLGKKVKEKAKDKVEQKILQKTDQVIEKAFDKTEEAVKGNGGNQTGVPQEAAPQQPVQQAPVVQDVPAEVAPEPQSLEMTYAKSDFVAGDEIFFEDNQANEQLGEFPSQWDVDYGNAEIVQMGGDKVIMTQGYTAIMPLIGDGKNYFPESFTVEFDIYPQHYHSVETATDQFEIGFNDSRTLVARFHTYRDQGCFLYTNWRKPNDDGGSSDSSDNNVYFSNNEWHHVAISFNKRACKIYVDGFRVLNIPNMKQPTSMWIWSNEKQAYFKNFRIAKGAVPLYDRMMSDGKFITYGITFDVGKATIKPESMGEINRIVQLMTENPDLKFSVEGHTDNTGKEASNQTLSEQRSQAIVDKLVELGIAKDRLTAVGKGQNSPIADNTTDEGRAKNRRVEFVKM